MEGAQATTPAGYGFVDVDIERLVGHSQRLERRRIPGPADDVVINVSGATPTVTIRANDESVKSITSEDPLVISGGGLAVTAAIRRSAAG